MINEQERHRLHNRLGDVLGESEAATLMAHLPPVGWADVATKHDIAALRESVDLKLQATEERLSKVFHQELNLQTRSLFVAIAAILAAYTGVVGAMGAIFVNLVR